MSHRRQRQTARPASTTQTSQCLNTRELLERDPLLRLYLSRLSKQLPNFLSLDANHQLPKIRPENLLNAYAVFHNERFRPNFQALNSRLISLNGYNNLELSQPMLNPDDVAAISALAHWFDLSFFYVIQLRCLLNSHPKLHIANTLAAALGVLETIIEKFQQNVFATAAAHTFFDEVGLCLDNECLSYQLKSAVSLAFAFCKETREWLAPLKESLAASDFDKRLNDAEKAQQALLAQYKEEKAARRVKTKPEPTPGNESPSTLSDNSESDTESKTPSAANNLKPISDYKSAKLLISFQQYKEANAALTRQLDPLPTERNEQLLRQSKLYLHIAVCYRLSVQTFSDCRAIYQHYHNALDALSQSMKSLNNLSSDFFNHNTTRLDALKRSIEVELYTLHSALEKLDNRVSDIVAEHQAVMDYLSEHNLHRGNNMGKAKSSKTKLFDQVKDLPPQIEACMSGVVAEANEIALSLSANTAP
ncbi:MAG: hypothetical protein COV52_03815 [Gammaproteobacteria bacterium CG11_big_fil_rev_8_21_14_0_20_46_22]|nr:MAG: hypothetical protein COW05_01865 [Gammaproteobacteria bacterium CG12_big_fil_rev_8_21_14_0_65_46_12]PIR11447.1 MAG: hypothetical protein COV52_03815 [Gammaproteobacteria bacterium CG11_big_fil_rev_8_21_14_0_20_46_22]